MTQKLNQNNSFKFIEAFKRRAGTLRSLTLKEEMFNDQNTEGIDKYISKENKNTMIKEDELLYARALPKPLAKAIKLHIDHDWELIQSVNKRRQIKLYDVDAI